MYNEYFGLADAPFSIAPNPQFLYMSERHREALAHLLYGIKSDGGFILLTGEVGTGKTTVCRCLLEQIPEDVDTAFVLNPKLTAVELVASVCDDLGVEYPTDATIKVLVDRLNQFLLASHREGRRNVLIIDEAQNLSADVLEQLRLLTNLETNQRKLLQIILLGQPELLEVLDRKELRQLAQRITARFHLDALTDQEVARYIRHRLDVAGCSSDIFRPAAVARICKLSGGVPRVINLICDRALLGAYSRDQRQVDRRIVDQAGREIFGHSTHKPARSHAFGVAAAVAVLAVAAIAYFAGRGELPGLHGQPVVASKTSTPAANTAKPALPDSSPDKGKVVPRPKQDDMATVASIRPIAPPQVDSLLNIEGDDSAEAAMSQLFKLWGVPTQASGDSPCEQAKQFGLACMATLGSLHDVAHLDRPAVINLSIAGIDNYLALTHLSGDIAELESSKGHFRLKLSDLMQSWDGHFAILWKPPPGYHTVRQGDKGATVDWLYRQLASIDGVHAAPDVDKPFSAELTERLKQFQIRQGLSPDGIAGAYTWIHINSLVNKEVPRLDATAGG